MSRCLIDLLLYNLYEPKHVQSLHYLSPVYAAQEKFENAALFSLQLDLPSTLIHQKERSFSKTLFKLEEFENASFYVMSVIFAGIRLSNFNFKSRFYGGPKLVVHNCHSKSQSHGTTNFTHGNTMLSHGKTKLTHGKTQFTHGKTKFTHGRTQPTHGKTKKTSWSAVVIFILEYYVV